MRARALRSPGDKERPHQFVAVGFNTSPATTVGQAKARAPLGTLVAVWEGAPFAPAVLHAPHLRARGLAARQLAPNRQQQAEGQANNAPGSRTLTAALSQFNSPQRLPPPWEMQRPEEPAWAEREQPGSSQRRPPPCAMQSVVGPTADLSQPVGNSHRFPPPWATHRPEEPLADFSHPSSSHRLVDISFLRGGRRACKGQWKKGWTNCSFDP